MEAPNDMKGDKYAQNSNYNNEREECPGRRTLCPEEGGFCPMEGKGTEHNGSGCVGSEFRPRHPPLQNPHRQIEHLRSVSEATSSMTIVCDLQTARLRKS